MKKSQVEAVRKRGTEKALAKLALACFRGSGVRLTAAEVHDIYGFDDALHARLYNEINEMGDRQQNESQKAK